MATSDLDIRTKITELRAEILSYKPGQAIPCDDERVVFPEKLVIGLIDPHEYAYGSYIIRALRSALLLDVEKSKHAGERTASTRDQGITHSISVIRKTGYSGQSGSRDVDEEALSRMLAKVACVVLCLPSNDESSWPRWIQQVQEIAGHPPICTVVGMDQVSQNERNVLKQHGVNDIYIVPGGDRSLSDQERFEALCLLHRCLVKGDVKLGSEGKKLMSETEKKRITEAKQEIEMRNEEIKTLQQKNIELETKLHDVSSSHDNLVQDNVSLKNELKDVKENRVQTQKELAETANGAIHMEEKYKQSELKYEESLMQISHKEEEMKLILQEKNYMETKLVSENGSLKNELKGVREQKEQIEVAMTDIKNIAKRTEEMYKKNEVKYEIELRSTKLRIYALMETVKKTEETAKQEMDRLKAEREKERAKFQVENKALKLVMKEKMESKDRHIEKLERETWKLRTKIQLESEMRSAEQKKKAEKPQSIFPWMASGKQAQTGTSKTKESSEDQSLTPDSDDLQSREESHNDAFADVLKQIADDLYDDSKIDSLGGQLGILQGNIERALKTNVKFNRFTSDGTRHMLQQWRRGVSREDERGELRRALLAAKLVDLADRHVPDETGASIKEVQAKEVKDDQSVGGENDIPATQGDLSSETKEDTTTDLTSLQVDPSTNTNTASIIDDPSTNTNEDSTTTNDNVPLLYNEEKAYELCCCCCF